MNTYYTLLPNQFLGLARGPIDHESSSVINVIANGEITMGSAVLLDTTIETAELLPRVEELSGTAAIKVLGQPTYGIAVGGDTDGIYGDGTTSTTDATRATAGAGEGVVVVTQGRCLARVAGLKNLTGTTAPSDEAISVGDSLVASESASETGSVLLALANTTSTATQFVIARALQSVDAGATDIIAVDIQREGDGNPQ